MMDLKNVLIVFITLANFAILMLVHFRSPRFVSIKYFKFATLMVFLWCLSMILYRFYANLLDAEMSTFWARQLYAFASLIPLSFIFHGLSFPDRIISKKILFPTLSVGIIYFLINSLTNLIVLTVDVSVNGEKTIVFNYLYYLTFPIYVSILFFSSYFIYFLRYKNSRGVFKYQIKLLLIGLIAASSIAMISNLLLPTFGVFHLNWLGQVMTTLWIILVGYAIAKHRFVDAKMIVVRTFSYILSLGFVVLGLGVLIISLTNLLFGNSRSFIEMLFLILLIGFTIVIFQPIKSSFDYLTQRWFHSGSYNVEDVLREITSVTVTHLELADLSNAIHDVFVKKFKSSSLTLYVFNDRLIEKWIQGRKKSLNQEEHLMIAYLISRLKKCEDNLLVSDEILDFKTVKYMERINSEVFLGLKFQNNLVGLLGLGEKSSGAHYSDDDFKVLSIIDKQLGVALANARAYEEIKNFNTTLKDEVARATKRLKTANKRLLQFDKLKDEFVSLASHELRTPMVSIRNYSWMLFNDKVGKLKPKQKEYARRIYESSTRLTRLVNSMLNISRIESGRILLSVEPTDILNLTQEVITELEGKAKEQGVVIEIKKTAKNLEKNQDQSLEKLPTVMIDSDKIKEVLVNLVGNSLKFTPKGGRVEISFSTDELFVHIQVKDTGAGLEEDEIPKLFKKFGMIRETYLMTAGTVQGTGLGLYICKSIIEMHGGEIGVHSQGRGKGSTFYFSLPKENNSTALKLKSGEKNGKDAGIIHSEVGGY